MKDRPSAVPARAPKLPGCSVGRGLLPRLGTVVLLAVLGMLPLSSGRPAASQRMAFDAPSWMPKSKPWLRWHWAFSQRAYPIGRLPQGARLRALRQIEDARARVPARTAAAKWTSIGPSPMRTDIDDRFVDRGQVSGRVADVAVDPKKSKHWLIGTAQGGIWETKNAGKAWTARTDDQPSLAVGAVAFAPSNPSIVYAGTGEAVFSGDSYAGTGVLKSKNGGKTWRLLGNSDLLDGVGFSDIAVHPSDPDTLVAATVRGINLAAFRAFPQVSTVAPTVAPAGPTP